MKRHFTSTDESIPASAWDRFPEYKAKLQRIVSIEHQIDQILQQKVRTSFAVHAEPEVKKKILRVFVHSTFTPSTAYDRSHFIVSVEGHLLDRQYKEINSFGNFFEKIRFQIDKKLLPQDKVIEWSAQGLPAGTQADCFRVKLYGDKPSSVRIFFHRSTDVRSRYELDAKLRVFLPNMALDPTEEDVLLAVWQYILNKNLFLETREKKYIRSDELLGELIGADTIPLSALRPRIIEHLLPSLPIAVDYNLNPVISASGSNPAGFGTTSFSKTGGRAFDIEVDVMDELSCQLVANANTAMDHAAQVQAKLEKLPPRASFIARRILDQTEEILQLQELISDPLGLRLLPASGAGRSPAGEACPVVPGAELACLGLGVASAKYDCSASAASSGAYWSQAEVGEQLARMMDFHRIIAARRSPMSAKPVETSEGSESPRQEASSSSSSSSSATATHSTLRKAAPDLVSTMFPARGFLDVGDDSLFAVTGAKRRAPPAPKAAVASADAVPAQPQAEEAVAGGADGAAAAGDSSSVGEPGPGTGTPKVAENVNAMRGKEEVSVTAAGATGPDGTTAAPGATGATRAESQSGSMGESIVCANPGTEVAMQVEDAMMVAAPAALATDGASATDSAKVQPLATTAVSAAAAATTVAAASATAAVGAAAASDSKAAAAADQVTTAGAVEANKSAEAQVEAEPAIGLARVKLEVAASVTSVTPVTPATPATPGSATSVAPASAASDDAVSLAPRMKKSRPAEPPSWLQAAADAALVILRKDPKQKQEEEQELLKKKAIKQHSKAIKRLRQQEDALRIQLQQLPAGQKQEQERLQAQIQQLQGHTQTSLQALIQLQGQTAAQVAASALLHKSSASGSQPDTAGTSKAQEEPIPIAALDTSKKPTKSATSSASAAPPAGSTQVSSKAAAAAASKQSAKPSASPSAASKPSAAKGSKATKAKPASTPAPAPASAPAPAAAPASASGSISAAPTDAAPPIVPPGGQSNTPTVAAAASSQQAAQSLKMSEVAENKADSAEASGAQLDAQIGAGSSMMDVAESKDSPECAQQEVQGAAASKALALSEPDEVSRASSAIRPDSVCTEMPTHTATLSEAPPPAPVLTTAPAIAPITAPTVVPEAKEAATALATASSTAPIEAPALAQTSAQASETAPEMPLYDNP